MKLNTTSKKKIEILFAEDQVLFRRSVLRDLKDFNIFCVGEADNGKEVLQLLETTIADIVLLDLNMPEMDGNEAFTIMRSKFSKAKIVILSLHDDPGLIKNYIERGAYGYLPKNVLIDTLAEAIIEVASGGKYFLKGSVDNKTKYSNAGIELIQELCKGKTNKQIAEKVGISEKGIEKRRHRIYSKTKSLHAADFLKNAFEKGLRFLGKK